MNKPIILVGVFALGLAGAVSAIANTLVLSDEECLERFVSDLTTAVPEARLSAALSNANPDLIPVELVAKDSARRFQDGDGENFAEEARKALSPLLESDIDVVEKSIEIEGDRALIALELSTAHGPVNARFRFVRSSDYGWLVDQMSVL
jgi:hypothetical protein